jgi:hypothetical protein
MVGVRGPGLTWADRCRHPNSPHRVALPRPYSPPRNPATIRRRNASAAEPPSQALRDLTLFANRAFGSRERIARPHRPNRWLRAVVGVLFGVLGAFVGLTLGAIKLVLFAVLPVALLGWVVMRLVGGGSRSSGAYLTRG